MDLRKFLHRHLNPESVKENKHIHYSLAELRELIRLALELVKEEKRALARASGPIVVVGDIHGQYYDLLRMFQMFNRGDVHGHLVYNYMFLGDYVDRGKRSVECICLVLTLKLLFPKRYTLLRGNHETSTINRTYGFYDDINDRFEQEIATELWTGFNEVFSWMPLAGLIGKKILCMHGGISPALHTLDDIENLPLPIDDPATTSELAMDLLWADPFDGTGFRPNDVRGVSVVFGDDMVKGLARILKVDLIIRAHQVFPLGYTFFANRQLLTVFSAPRYGGESQNNGAVALIHKDGRVQLRILRPPQGIAEASNSSTNTNWSAQLTREESMRQASSVGKLRLSAYTDGNKYESIDGVHKVGSGTKTLASASKTNSKTMASKSEDSQRQPHSSASQGSQKKSSARKSDNSISSASPTGSKKAAKATATPDSSRKRDKKRPQPAKAKKK